MIKSKKMKKRKQDICCVGDGLGALEERIRPL